MIIIFLFPFIICSFSFLVLEVVELFIWLPKLKLLQKKINEKKIQKNKQTKYLPTTNLFNSWSSSVTMLFNGNLFINYYVLFSVSPSRLNVGFINELFLQQLRLTIDLIDWIFFPVKMNYVKDYEC